MGNPPVTGRLPSQRSATRGFDVLFDVHLNRRFCKQSICWWFETPWCSLWHQCNESPGVGWIDGKDISMNECKTAVTPQLTHWSYCRLTLSHRYMLNQWPTISLFIILLSKCIYLGTIFSIHCALQWRRYGRDSVSIHQPRDCLLNCLFRRRSKKTSKLGVTGLCAGNPPGIGEFPAQLASYVENVSIWWRHHGYEHSTHLSLRDVKVRSDSDLWKE